MSKDKLPTPEVFFSDQLPEDNVTPEQFDDAVQNLRNFSELDISSVKDRDDFARVTRDLGLSVQRLVLSCGQVQIVGFSFEDPRKISRGDALIQAGDVNLGNEVKKNSETSLSSKCMIIRTKEEDGSSTIVSTKGKDDEFLLITNHRIEDKRQLGNYNVKIPVLLEIDRVKNWPSVGARDWRPHPMKEYYPLKEGSDITVIHNYLEVLQTLIKNLLKHLKTNKFID